MEIFCLVMRTRLQSLIVIGMIVVRRTLLPKLGLVDKIVFEKALIFVAIQYIAYLYDNKSQLLHMSVSMFEMSREKF